VGEEDLIDVAVVVVVVSEKGETRCNREVTRTTAVNKAW